MELESTRPYRQGARAASAARTAERILDAASALFWEQPTDRLSLDEVARRAEVSTQTVIRRFGGRDGLMAAAGEREAARIRRMRDAAPVDDPTEAVAVLAAHYEEVGDAVIRLLAEEERSPALADIVRAGREYHAEWCARVFARTVDGVPAGERARVLAQLTAVCDVYTWKVLRRDAGLGARETLTAITELVAAIEEHER
ncbi:MAG: helix-turn-helix domain-containing protein [Miltoncostaeaceae bacterium]